MPGIPVVIDPKSDFAVRPVSKNQPTMQVVSKGGIPIRISDKGVPFIVEGLEPSGTAPTLTGGTMVQDGPDLVFTDPVATGTPAPTVTFKLERNGVNVTSSRVGNRVTNFTAGLYVATWTATNGINPDAVKVVQLDPVAYDTDALALFSRFTVQPDNARKQVINDRFVAGKATSWWAKMDALWVHAAHTEQAGLQNWLAANYASTAVNGPVFTPNRGFASDGVTSYVASGYSTGPNMKFKQTDATFAVYSNTDSPSGRAIAGNWGGGTLGGTSISTKNANSQSRVRLNQSTIYAPINPGTGIGLFTITRTGTGDINVYRNGVNIGTSTLPSLAVITQEIMFGGDTSTNLTSDQFGMGIIGSGFTAAEVMSMQTWFKVYSDAVGLT